MLHSPPEQALSNALLLAAASVLLTLLAAFAASNAVFSFADRSTNVVPNTDLLYPEVEWIEKDGQKLLEMKIDGDFPGILWKVLSSLQQRNVDIESLRQRQVQGGVQIELGVRTPKDTTELDVLTADLRRLEFKPVPKRVGGRHFLIRAGIHIHAEHGALEALTHLTDRLAKTDINIESIRVSSRSGDSGEQTSSAEDQGTVELVIVTPWDFHRDRLLATLDELTGHSGGVSDPFVPQTIETIELDINEATAHRAQTLLREALDQMPGWSPGKAKLEEWFDIPRQIALPTDNKVDEAFIANLRATIRMAQFFHAVRSPNNSTLPGEFWPAAMPQFRRSDPELAYLTHPLETAYNRVVTGERNPITVMASILHDAAEDAAKQVWEWISPEVKGTQDPIPLKNLRERALEAFSKVLYDPSAPGDKPDWLDDFRKNISDSTDAARIRNAVFEQVQEILRLRIRQNIATCPEVVIEDMERLTLDRGSQYEENLKKLARGEVRRTDRTKMEEQLQNLRTLSPSFQRKIVAKSLRNMTTLLMRDLSDPPPTYDNGSRYLRLRYLRELAKQSFLLTELPVDQKHPAWLSLQDFVQEKEKIPGNKEMEDLSYTAKRSIKAIKEFHDWLGKDSLAREALSRDDIKRFRKQLAALRRQLEREDPSRNWLRPLRSFWTTTWAIVGPYLVSAKEGRHVMMAQSLKRFGMEILHCWVDPQSPRGQVTVLAKTRRQALLFLIADPLGDLIMMLASLTSTYWDITHTQMPALQIAILTITIPLVLIFFLSGTSGSSEDWSQIGHFLWHFDPNDLLKPLVGHAKTATGRKEREQRFRQAA